MERLTTGNSRLDQILGGGLVADAITLIVGAPGTGKTILAEQCLFANATVERPGLYLSTVSEPFDKLLRFGQEQSFFDTELVGRSVFYDDLGDAVHHGGLGAVSERIESLIRRHHPGMIVIDSFKALRTFSPSDADFRRFLHDLAGVLSAIAVSSLWVGEYQHDEATTSPEFAVADAVIGVETKRTSERSTRLLSVRKLRGSDFLPGDHAYRITADGLVVFPRLADPRDTGSLMAAGERRPTGIPALDESMEGGYWSGSTTLVAGPTGSAKTLMGLHFVYSGTALGEKAVFVTLQENRSQLARIVSRFGWSIDDPSVVIMNRSPVDVYLDELIYDVLDRLETVGAHRLVIDSLNDLMAATTDPMRFREFLYSLVQRCSQHGINAVLTYETMELFGTTRLSELGMSHIADNVILLQHVQHGSEMKRALTVLKARGSDNSTAIKEFRISSDGIELGEPLDISRLSG